MNEITIRAAAIRSLEILGKPSKLDIILNGILKNGFYNFPAKGPKNVLNTELIRATKGLRQLILNLNLVNRQEPPVYDRLLTN